ncbi:MAG: homocysteine S-methyltransferase family protein, partial [Planctomycetota bacterium]
GERVEAERDRAAGLVEGGIDAVLVETARDLAQVHAALVAVRSCDPDLPTLVSFTVEADGRIASGATMEDVAAGARDLGVDVLALNCCAGPASLEDPLGRLRTAWEGPLGAWPNAGLPTRESSGWRWPVAPDELAAWMRLRSVEHDLRVIGGCCGSSVAHVAALRALWPRRPPI